MVLLKKILYAFLFITASLSFVMCTNTGNPAGSEGQHDILPIRTVKIPVVVEIKESPAGDYIEYSNFGAAGDGKHDDFNALLNAHRYANEKGLKVKADSGATYYLSGVNNTIPIQTDTDWGDAQFIIDDRRCQNRNAQVFMVTSKLPSYEINDFTALKKGQPHLGRTLDTDCLAIAVNRDVRRYIRYGLNQNSGSPQTDVFIVFKNGTIEKKAPVIWDFDKITSLTLYPIDAQELTITGGVFTTIANQAESKYTYHNRGIMIQRSRVTLDNITHHVTGELSNGAPYFGFISITDCAYVKIQNCALTGRKTYYTIGSAGKKVPMGTYDLTANRAVNVTYLNCKQTNDILDSRFWGIFASNYCKNLVFEGCVLSRFDAHMGVVNATIRYSTFGHQGINAIGSGLLIIENCKLLGGNLVNLRQDYGSTWEGDVIIRNCEFIPKGGAPSDVVLIGGENRGTHDFGYVCHMPGKVTIDGLVIHDGKPPRGYDGPKIFADFNPACTNASYEWMYPYIVTQEVMIKNLTTKSGLSCRISSNQYMFRNVILYSPAGK